MNSKRIFLSIDIDFYSFDKKGYRNRNNDFSILANCKNPIKCYTNHNHMLPYINSSQYDELINIDAHNDLALFDEHNIKNTTHVDIGTWVDFVKWRKTGKYTWIHPYKTNKNLIHYGDCSGNTLQEICNDYTNIKLNSNYKKYKSHVKSHGWNEIVFTNKRISLRSLLQKNEVTIGLCLSPEYSDEKDFDFLKNFVNINNINVKRGFKNEDNAKVKIKSNWR